MEQFKKDLKVTAVFMGIFAAISILLILASGIIGHTIYLIAPEIINVFDFKGNIIAKVFSTGFVVVIVYLIIASIINVPIMDYKNKKEIHRIKNYYSKEKSPEYSVKQWWSEIKEHWTDNET